MKKITAYVNTLRVHWLVEELQAVGVKEIMVTEYFRPQSQISRLEFCCEDVEVEQMSGVIHRLGTTGKLPDHNLNVEEFDPSLPSQFPIGKRASRLEESRIKQLISTMLQGLTTKLSMGYLFITISIVVVGVFINVRIGSFQRSSREARETIQLVSEATQQITRAIIEEMLATDQLHHGEVIPGANDFERAHTRLDGAVLALRHLSAVNSGKLDSLENVERKFQTTAEEMLTVLGVGSTGTGGNIPESIQRASAHTQMMAGLNNLHLKMMDIMYSLELEATDLGTRKEGENDKAMDGVRLSLTVLACASVLITLVAWLFSERKIGRPLHMIVEEAKTIDTGQLG
jgi:hypothetical protein